MYCNYMSGVCAAQACRRDDWEFRSAWGGGLGEGRYEVGTLRPGRDKIGKVVFL